MGDPRKSRKTYETPRNPWRKDQLEVELRLIGDFGLRNKKELWRYKTMLSNIRGIARSLLGASELERSKQRDQYLSRLRRMGVLSESASIDEVLDLDIRDLLERRLQTVVLRRGFARSMQQARQMIIHGHISVGDRIVSIPSYLVGREEDGAVAFASESPLSSASHPMRKIIAEATIKEKPP